mgnify:CR=1 FL=1
MSNLTIAKFGGSAIGIDGEGIPDIVKRIKEIQKDSKVIVVCSAPLTLIDGKKKSLTDVILGIGNNVVNGDEFDFSIVEKPYLKILEYINNESRDLCKEIINEFLKKSKNSIDEALDKKEFLDETRSKALAFSGEVLMSHVLNLILKSNEIKSDTISLEDWPIITDNNIESTNFLRINFKNE